MKQPSIQIRQCPFCGSKTAPMFWTSEEQFEDMWDGSNELSYQVVCDASSPNGRLGCGGAGGFRSTVELAAEVWNRRR